MFTEEPSQQLAPLPTEHAEPPEVRLDEALQPARKETWLAAWSSVARAIGIWVSSVLLLVLVPIAVTVPYLIYRIVKLGPPSPEALTSDKMIVFFTVAGVFPTHLLTLVVIWLAVSHGARRPFWKTIDFRWPASTTPSMVTMMSVLMALFIFGVAWGVTYLWGDRKTDLDLMIESSIYTRVVTAFVAVATAPLVEELIYRGLLYQALEKAAGVAVAVVFVSLLFAGVHVFQYRNNVAVIAVITLLSITLTIARAVSGSVIPPFIIHLVFNGIQSVLIVLGGFIDKDFLK